MNIILCVVALYLRNNEIETNVSSARFLCDRFGSESQIFENVTPSSDTSRHEVRSIFGSLGSTRKNVNFTGINFSQLE